jgi:hypothetical protein
LAFAALGLYIFIHAKAGMYFVTLPSFVLILGGIMTSILFYSKSHMAKNEPLADFLGLKITKYLSVLGKSRVDMRGEINGFEVFLRRKTFSHARQKLENYIFAIRINNPAKINLYIKPEGAFNTPLGTVPPKLNGAQWHWPDFIKIYGKPFNVVNALFKDEANSTMFHHFFAKITCKIEGKDMEFYTKKIPEPDFLNYEEVKNLFDLGTKIALKIEHLPPSLN